MVINVEISKIHAGIKVEEGGGGNYYSKEQNHWLLNRGKSNNLWVAKTFFCKKLKKPHIYLSEAEPRRLNFL